MNRMFALAAALCLLAAPSFAQKVTVDWDKDFDFDSINTYQWVEPKEAPANPLMQQRIQEAMQYHLAMRGVERVESGGDVLITYHGDIQFRTPQFQNGKPRKHRNNETLHLAMIGCP